MLSPTRQRLDEWTTLRLGGAAEAFTAAGERGELYDLVAQADAGAEAVLVLGGGSNLVVGDGGFAGTVVHVATRGLRESASACAGAEVTVEAGESWDTLVARAVSSQWVGIEALSGIPGTVGASPIQNVGAYGQEVSDTVSRVHVWDRLERRAQTLFAADCGFGYRTSLLKKHPGRYVVGAVTFQFRLGDVGVPVQYAELARALDVEVGARVTTGAVRDAVLALRRGKGMVLDSSDHDTWSAGSFFTNPFVAPASLPEGAPSYPQPDGSVKTSAAWLIEQAGFPKGYGNAAVSVSTKHTLALTNRGGAATSELLALAREIRRGVHQRFGIELQPEPVCVSCAL